MAISHHPGARVGYRAHAAHGGHAEGLAVGVQGLALEVDHHVAEGLGGLRLELVVGWHQWELGSDVRREGRCDADDGGLDVCGWAEGGWLRHPIGVRDEGGLAAGRHRGDPGSCTWVFILPHLFRRWLISVPRCRLIDGCLSPPNASCKSLRLIFSLGNARCFGSRSWRRVGHQARNHIAADGGASGCGWSGEPGGDDGQGQKPGAVVAVGAGGTAAVGAADVVAVGTPIPTIPPGPIISFKPAVVP